MTGFGVDQGSEPPIDQGSALAWIPRRLGDGFAMTAWFLGGFFIKLASRPTFPAFKPPWFQVLKVS